MSKDELIALIKATNSANTVFFTNSGHKLSLKEHKFINHFLVDGDVGAAAKNAGYELTGEKDTYAKIGSKILRRDYIYEEMLFRLEEMDKATVADAQEVMQYFTAVMRGQEKDQFGLDAPLSERTAAAKELARRVIDTQRDDAENKAIKIELDWKRD